MNTGQTMLVLGAFTMLSIFALNTNRMMVGSVEFDLEMEATLNAASIGQSMLDEILSKSFDENATQEKIYQATEATPENLFGTDASDEVITGIDSLYQSKSKYDDVDDYHLYRRVVRDSRLGLFYVIDSVKYVEETTPDRSSATQTFYKVITVAVMNQSLPKQMNTDQVIPVILRDISIYRRYF